MLTLLLALACTHKESADSNPNPDSTDTGETADTVDSADTTETGGDPILGGTYESWSAGYSDDGTDLPTWTDLIGQPFTLAQVGTTDQWTAGWPLAPDVLSGTVTGSTGHLAGEFPLTANDCTWTMALDLELANTFVVGGDGETADTSVHERGRADTPSLLVVGTGTGTDNGAASCPALALLVSDDGTSPAGSMDLEDERRLNNDPERNYGNPGTDNSPFPHVRDRGIALASAPNGSWTNASSSSEGHGGLARGLMHVGTSAWTLGTAADGRRTLGWLGEVATLDASPDGNILSGTGSTDVTLAGCSVHLEAEVELTLTDAQTAAYAVRVRATDDGAADCVELAWAWNGMESLDGVGTTEGTREWRI